MATPTSSAAPTTQESVCNTCQKPGTASGALKTCAKCQTTKYCSRECQKSDWKAHKKLCGGGEPAPSHNPGFHAMNQALGLGGNDFLHKLSQKDAFTQIIDCFRMRCEDEYTFGANTVGIYNQENPMREFKKFLDLAEKRKGILPSWWNKEKRAECVTWATRGSWPDINCAVEKSDIQEHYGDASMPMKLRILGEKIYGKGFM